LREQPHRSIVFLTYGAILHIRQALRHEVPMRSEAAASREDARRSAGDLDKRCIDTIRTLAMDAVEKANSGHAGTPMGLAPVVYTICSDGDMMEGVASEAASLAGHLQLSNLCWIYDSNTVTIEGHTDLAMSEDVAARFKAYRWNVLRLQDANDTTGFARAVEIFRGTKDRPTLIIVDSIIGYGAPHKQNTAAAHSDALGKDEVRL